VRLISHVVGVGAGLFVISGRPPTTLPEFLISAGAVALVWFCFGALTVEGFLDELAAERDQKAAAAEPPPPPPEPPRPKALPAGSYDAVGGRSLLGHAWETGEPVWLTWAGNAGCVVGGVPGSGKTGSLLPVIAGLAGRAELHVFDGKGSYDLAIFEPVAATFSRSVELDSPVETLARLEELIELRATAIHKSTGMHDFWAVPVATRESLGLYPIFLLVDECQTWLTTSGLTGAEKKTVEGIIRSIRGLVQRGRFAGISSVLTTQKPAAATLPTIIRDNCSNKICFRTTTGAQARTVLGDVAEDAPAPSDIPGTAKGACVVVSDSGAAVATQAGYVDHKTLSAHISSVSKPPDQYSVAKKLAGKD
jgi:S-DNA-T family DNA segregation ATPase FtsK/SpoIIIE